ncbi:MAG: hypothetical protein AAF682_03685 [Planctomycetota bacterium]
MRASWISIGLGGLVALGAGLLALGRGAEPTGEPPGRLALARQAVTQKRQKLAGQGSKAFDQPAEAARFFLEQRLGEDLQRLPLEHLQRELGLLRRREAEPVAGAAPGGIASWTSLGPGNIGGRTRALLIDPSDPDVMYAAGVSGGVWKSTDAGASWAATDDAMLNLKVSCLAMDPSDPAVLYAGTGEGFLAIGHLQGLGIFKSTDAGATWTQLAGTVTGVPGGAFDYVNDLVVSPNDPGRIYAATRTGVWRSTDSGASWTPVLSNPAYLDTGPSTVGCYAGCTDLALRPDAAPDQLFASFGSFAADGLYRSDDGGDGWFPYSVPSNQGRMKVEFAPSDNDVVYLAMADNGTVGAVGQIVNLWRSDDGGATFNGVLDLGHEFSPWLFNNLILSTGCSPGETYAQGWYDLALAVDPVDPLTVWLGGVDLFRSVDGGATFELAGYWFYYLEDPPPPSYIHPDHHAVVFHPDYDGAANQTLFVGNDGGIFRTQNARAAATLEDCPFPGTLPPPEIVWESLNNGYGVTQFYHGDAARTADVFIGGTQDNGTNAVTSATAPEDWRIVYGGDGGYTHVDPADEDHFYVETHNWPDIWRTFDGGLNFLPASNGISDADGLFITPIAMDPGAPLTLWTGGSRPWRTKNGATLWSVAGPDLPLAGTISAIAVAPSNSDVVYLGFDNGYVARTSDGTASSPSWQTFSTGLLGGWVSSLAVDPTVPDVAYLTSSTYGVPHVLRTTNGGATWTSIDGIGLAGVPDIPAHWIAVRPCDSEQLYVGTELGVFASDDAGATWAPANTGLAHTIVETLDFQDESTLVAFTHGRGAFRASLAPCPPSPSAYGCGVNPAGSLLWQGLPHIGDAFELLVHDPTGSMGILAQTWLLISNQPDPAYPCGTLFPGWGMTGAAAAGELLIGLQSPNPLVTAQGLPWIGSPREIVVSLPDDPLLVGLALYAQGALVDFSPNVGLTEAVEFVISD